MDYKEAIISFIKELNLLAYDPFTVRGKKHLGSFKWNFKESTHNAPNTTLSSSIYYQEEYTGENKFSIRRQYMITPEILKSSRIPYEELKNYFFKQVYKDLIRWSVMAKKDKHLKDDRGNTIYFTTARDLIINGYYEGE